MTTRPGFSSRSTEQRTSQFPHRDEASMNEHEEAGWSNSAPADQAPQAVYPDIEDAEELDPGFSNGKAVKNAAESKVVSDEKSEDKSAAKKAPAAKKKG